MKIIEIGTGYTPIPAKMGAATEIVVEELIKAFRHNGNKCMLVDIAAKNRVSNDFDIAEVHIPSIFTTTDIQLGILHKAKRVIYSICLAYKLKSILMNTDEDVVLHFHNQYNLFFFLKLVNRKMRRKARIAYTVHSYIWPDEWEKIEETIRKRYFQEVYCVKNADIVFVLNKKTRNNLVKYLSVKPERIHEILNGVNTDIYSPLPDEEKEKIKEEFDCIDKKVVLQVGSVCDRKNQLGFLRSFAGYLKENTEVVYMYAGGIIDKEYQHEIERFSRENGLANQVRYVGEISPGKELNKYYNIASVTVFPSKIESFGLVIIESISAGTPVLLYSKPLFELDNGYTVVHKGENLEQNIVKLMSADSLQGRIEIEKKYSWFKVAGDHLKFFKGENMF